MVYNIGSFKFYCFHPKKGRGRVGNQPPKIWMGFFYASQKVLSVLEHTEQQNIDCTTEPGIVC